MLLETGDKILLAHRRLFDHDEPRYFVGEVVAYEHGVAKVTGYSFVREILGGGVIRKNDLRVKLVSLVSGAVIAYQLPQDVDVQAVRFELKDAQLTLTDGKLLSMNMTEGPHRGRI